MMVVALLSSLAVATGVAMVNLARSPPVANAGMIVVGVGAACLALACLALVFR